MRHARFELTSPAWEADKLTTATMPLLLFVARKMTTYLLYLSWGNHQGYMQAPQFSLPELHHTRQALESTSYASGQS